MNNLNVHMKEKKISKINKIWLIYDEFSQYAPEDVTRSELLKASQDLINLSKNDYIHSSQKDKKNKLSYQNCDLVEAFAKYENKIFRDEYSKMKNDYHEKNENISSSKFKKINKLSN